MLPSMKKSYFFPPEGQASCSVNVSGRGEITDGEKPLAASRQSAAAFDLDAAAAFQQRSLPVLVDLHHGKKPRSCSSVQSRWQQMSDFYMMDVSINDFLQDLNLIFRGQVLILPFWARGGGTRGRGMPRTALLCVP